MRGHYRHTKIIATLGPATESASMLERLINAGVDVIRLNMAHGSVEWVADVVARARQASIAANRHVAIMMDVKGPEIRTGPVEAPIELDAGDAIEFHTVAPTPGILIPSLSVNYAGFPADVSIGATVLVDSGLMRLEVLDKDDTHVRCRALTPGKLVSRRHINLPGVDVNLPSLTEKDERDIQAGVRAGIDFVALSFVRKSDDIQVLRAYLDKLGSRARIIAKIEDQGGLRNLKSIVQVSDAIMVARGDLGIEVDYYTLALVQTRIVEECLREGKPVIIATHLLESMIGSPMPTRAEISDVSNAVRERADAVMLSGETTTGLYPLDCVTVLKNILGAIEPTETRGLNEMIELHEPKAKMLRSAAMLAGDLGGERGESGIVVFTRSGMLAYTLAALRAVKVPIYAFTDDETLFRQLILPWGVEPFLMPFNDDPEQTIRDALQRLKDRGWCAAGTVLAVITNALARDKIIDTLQLRRIE